MKSSLIGWVTLWCGLLLTVVAGRHAAGYFGESPDLSTICGGAPAPTTKPNKPPAGNGWCAAASCSCATTCTIDNNTGLCTLCTSPTAGSPCGAGTNYLCCVNKSLGPTSNCFYAIGMGPCGALTTIAPNPPPAAPCQNPNGTGICLPPVGGEACCMNYQIVNAQSTPCPP